MDIREALKEQYHAGLAMLGQCVDLCPDDMWTAGAHPRTYYRIAFHAAFFTHLYLVQNEAAFQPWPARREGWHPGLWEDPAYMEPYELPEGAETYSQSEISAYIRFIDEIVDSTVDSLDLETNESGYRWYESISKLSHELMNLRHIQGHVGQLSELLMERGIDIDWVSGNREG
jgi:hypothetical protein